MYAEGIQIYEKSNLTISEASTYFNIGVNKLRKMTNSDDCKFVLWVVNKRLIKRKQLEAYLEKELSI